MIQIVSKWFRVAYKKTVTSIAFIPAVIALFFLLLSILALDFDSSPMGKNIKSNLHWLSLKDASTARSICSAIASGTISLTVFSFSMVMILLNQAASQMSNRIIDKLIGNRFQQTVLGFYIGTIVYALFLLSTIRDLNSGIYVPAISTYLLIAMTIVDIFLFIYFLHYITQSVKYETIIHRIYNHTKDMLEEACVLENKPEEMVATGNAIEITAYKSGIYQGFDKHSLLQLCEKEDVVITFHHPVGAFLMGRSILLTVSYKKELSNDFEKQLRLLVNIHRGEDINVHYFYGFKQLMEVAIKALSPGINDPDTAVISLQALTDLLAYRLLYHPEINFKDEKGTLRIISKEKTFEELFEGCILPIWDYGKSDRLVQREMSKLLNQLQNYGSHSVLDTLVKSI